MAFTISKQFRFEAAHQLHKHDGKCARLHGHSWVLTVFVVGSLIQDGPQTGMVMDYGRLKEAVMPLVEDKLDHYFLNESTGLANPTSEELARFCFAWLFPRLPGLVAVEISETCTTGCRYGLPWNGKGASVLA